MVEFQLINLMKNLFHVTILRASHKVVENQLAVKAQYSWR